MFVNKYIRSLLIGFLALASMASCTRDVTTVDTGRDDSAMVKLSIYTPNSSTPAAVRSASADENAVARIKVIVLQLTGGEYRYRYMVDGEQIMQSNLDTQRTTFSAKLTSSDIPLKLLLIANYNDVFSGDEIPKDLGETAVKAMLVDSFDSGAAGAIPLYGEIEVPQLKAENPANLSVTMLRGLARVDVNNTIDTTFSEDFRLARVAVWRANDRINTVPQDGSLQADGTWSITSPEVPSSATVYAPYGQNVALDGDLSVLKTYIPESEAVTALDLQTSTATCVIVGGYYADDTDLSYYRIDFDSGLDGHPFGQILRNHKYIFNIMQVNARGWPTEEEAANNVATSIIATMQVWDEMTSEMWFSGNENYLGISSRRIVLDYIAFTEKTEYLQATVPFRIQPIDGNGDPVGSEITKAGESFTNDFYKLELVKDNTDGEDVWRLVVTTLTENKSPSQYTGGFQVFTDWWTFDVEVIQENYAGMYAGRYVRILTITDLNGDLGDNDGTFSELSGGATRRMLENKANFSPTGTVPVGGIIVYNLMNSTISSEDSGNLYILEKMLASVDVVHLPYLCSPSVTASRMIYDWLDAKPNRVLILGTDCPETNANLIDMFDVDGEWFNGTGDIRTITSAYAGSPGTDPFFKGVFGNVDERTEMGMTKEIVGYTNGYNWETTVPILMVGPGGTNFEGWMTHGVNQTHGIVYFGESGVTASRGTAMSAQADADGTVETQFDILMANLWAWIVERAVMVSGSVTR